VREQVLLPAAAAIVLVLSHSAAHAQSPGLDMLKVLVSGPSIFENQVAEVGQGKGIFKQHGLKLEVRSAQSSGETLAAVVAGAADIGMSVDTLGAIAAFAKGAPVRVIGSAVIGATEFWYVPATSRIKSLKEAAGKTVAYSATGSASNLMVLGLQELHGIKLKPVPTGDPAVTLAQVMSGKVDVGYGVPPFGVAELEQGKIRIVARANDMSALAKQTLRFIVANADALEKRPDAFRRYLQGYRKTVDWMFSSDPQAVVAYAEWAGVAESVARRTRDELLLKENVLPDRIAGLDTILADAVTYKLVNTPLTAEQVKTLVQLQAPGR
jgi:ABC-type nitrate/sulfonate/bicarbonate transport system substrate-binding protein